LEASNFFSADITPYWEENTQQYFLAKKYDDLTGVDQHTV
jgi:hypothetical protein